MGERPAFGTAPIRCGKTRCSWRGYETELRQTPGTMGGLRCTTSTCPKCGNDEYMFMTPGEIKAWERKKRSNGEHVNLEKIAMPPRMKAREIAIEQFGSFKDDDGSDAEICFGALEYFLEWLIQQGWSKAPQPAPAPLSDDVVKDAARYRWLRATTNYVTSNGKRIDVRNMPEKWDAAIDAARAAQEGKSHDNT